MHCRGTFADYYFKPNIGGYEALKNSVYFGKINNTSPHSLLTSYHSIVEDIAENEKSYNDYVVNQETYLSTQFDLSLILASAFFPQDFFNKEPHPNLNISRSLRNHPIEMSLVWPPFN